MQSYIYLASPYSDPDPLVRELRYLQALRATADILRSRRYVYSPIVHCHEIAKRFQLPMHFDFWKDYNMTMLRQAQNLIILMGDGWKQSEGILAESNEAMRLNIPRSYLELEPLCVSYTSRQLKLLKTVNGDSSMRGN